jgi:NAD(P) transhydrogenase
VVYFGKRTPNTTKLGLHKLGIDLDDLGYIKVNSKYQSSIKNIYGSGDVIGFPALASASFNQGRMSSCHMFGYGDFELPSDIPFGIYSIPEVSSIGYTEKEAKKLGIECTVGRAYYHNVPKANISNNEKGMLKIVFDNHSLKLLGVQIIGESACDLIHLGQSVIAFEGKVYYFINHVMNHPTYSELYRVATFNGLNRLNKTGAKYRNG